MTQVGCAPSCPAELVTVYVVGLFQGLALVAFPAASSQVTDYVYRARHDRRRLAHRRVPTRVQHRAGAVESVVSLSVIFAFAAILVGVMALLATRIVRAERAVAPA